MHQLRSKNDQDERLSRLRQDQDFIFERKMTTKQKKMTGIFSNFKFACKSNSISFKREDVDAVMRMPGAGLTTSGNSWSRGRMED